MRALKEIKDALDKIKLEIDNTQLTARERDFGISILNSVLTLLAITPEAIKSEEEDVEIKTEPHPFDQLEEAKIEISNRSEDPQLLNRL